MISHGQLELDYSARVMGAAPDVSDEDVERLIAFLDGRDWTTGREIQAALGWNERKVRAASRASRPRIVSFPGSRGYKRFELCTVPEHDACVRAFRAQRDDMDASLLIYSRAYHSRFAGTPAGT